MKTNQIKTINTITTNFPEELLWNVSILSDPRSNPDYFLRELMNSIVNKNSVEVKEALTERRKIINTRSTRFRNHFRESWVFYTNTGVEGLFDRGTKIEVFPIEVIISQDDKELLDATREDFIERVKGGDAFAIAYLTKNKDIFDKIFNTTYDKDTYNNALKTLQNNLSKKELINRENDYGFSPIYIATAMNNKDFINTLLVNKDLKIKPSEITNRILPSDLAKDFDNNEKMVSSLKKFEGFENQYPESNYAVTSNVAVGFSILAFVAFIAATSISALIATPLVLGISAAALLSIISIGAISTYFAYKHDENVLTIKKDEAEKERKKSSSEQTQPSVTPDQPPNPPSTSLQSNAKPKPTVVDPEYTKGTPDKGPARETRD